MLSRQKLTVLVGIFIAVFAVSFSVFTKSVNASALTGASLTLTNSRMSYKAAVSAGAASQAEVTITTGGGYENTNHLFPGDSVCFTDAAAQRVCRDNKTYTVSDVLDTTHFLVNSNLTTALTATDYVVASQSGRWTLNFTTVNAVPVGGTLTVTIPKVNGSGLGSDGMPDTSSAVSTSGFDINKLVAANVTFNSGGCTSANWGTPVVTAGASTTTTIVWTRVTTQCDAASAFSIYIGTAGSQATTQIVNPAPITSGHTQGGADVYGITVATADGSANAIDSAIVQAAPVEAVLVSATVNESLTFTIAGKTGGAQTYCGAHTYVTTSATGVPWGAQAPSGGFKYAAQQLTVSTNGVSGYIVTTQESDQMGRAAATGVAVTCSGTAPSTGNYTFTGTNYCIRDTVCTAASASCTESTVGDWTSATDYGLGYTLATQAGTTPASFCYNCNGKSYAARQFADIQGSETVATIMTTTTPVSGDSAYVCYTLSLPGDQPAGYYYNVVQYTATATF